MFNLLLVLFICGDTFTHNNSNASLNREYFFYFASETCFDFTKLNQDLMMESHKAKQWLYALRRNLGPNLCSLYQFTKYPIFLETKQFIHIITCREKGLKHVA